MMRSPGKKYFLWFITLILVMACAPSMVTPVAPLDPNAISTYIVQTAEAAATQTQRAVPPTATITSTPRSTFTPESTPTLIPVIDFPTSTPIQRVQYFRVKHDNQLAIYDYQSRTAARDWHGINLFTPETVPLFVNPQNGAGTIRTKVDGSWGRYIDSLNGNDAKKLRYLKADNTGLFNTSGFPNLESLTMGGNIVTLAEITNGWGRVNTFDYERPGVLSDITYATRPDLVHKFVVVGYKKDTKSTYWLNTPQGSIYWPLVASRPVWVSMDRLEPFPILPMEVTAKKTQPVRVEPATDAEETGSNFSEGSTRTVVEYYPSGGNVWGRLYGGGWIALTLHWEYPTSWSMATLPPP
jgi:hypothetical protein